MKTVKLGLISAVAALFISYAFVVLFLMIGPLYVNGVLAIKQTGLWTAILTCIIFFPIFAFLKRRSARTNH